MADGGGVHLAFGADPARSMVVSWLTDGPVSRPMVRFAPVDPDAAEPGEAYATTSTYRDADRRRVYVQHATLVGLRPGVHYRYEISPALGGSEPPASQRTSRAGTPTGDFRTAPRAGGTGEGADGSGAGASEADGSAFTFTCFGDHGTDQEDDPYGTPASGAVVAAVDMLAPLFHLALGDLSYASLRRDPAEVWADWFRMIAPSASRRPWMPVAGNHESERGLGRFGLDSYQAYFQLPDNGAGGDFQGLWYAFTVGRVRFVVLFGEDACYQEHGLVYLRGFSGGRQTAWLEQTLRAARADPEIDWVIVAMHQVAMSTAAYHNGGDLGLREEWLPLFDRYEVDLVLCGHEHHYERTHPVRGVVPGSRVLTPRPVVPVSTSTAATADAAVSPTAPTVPMAARTATPPGLALAGEVVDTTSGTVHVTIGTGGSSSPSTGALFHPPAGQVVIEPEPPDPPAGPGRRRFGKSPVSRRRTIHVTEGAPWLAARSTDHPYAFAALHVDPGIPGGTTTIRLTVHDSLTPDEPPFDEVLFTRPRHDAVPD
nr:MULTISPECIES: metallophosphoesterase family protein [Pseudofrankia]